MPDRETALYDRLSALEITHRTIEHPPVFTVQESQNLRVKLDGAHIKNLFLKDRKKRLWLCSVLEDRKIDLKLLRKQLGAQGNLSFGSPESLMDVLGVIPGAVTPLAVFNDRERQVTLVLDDGLFEYEEINCHPLRNDKTTTLKSDDLLRFIEAEGYKPIRMNFTASPDPESNLPESNL